jgi:hypothetical protein
MKRKTISIVLAAVMLLTMGLATTLPVGSATEADIQTAIDNGIAYLVAQQNMGTGQFIGEYGELGETSLAVLKLLDRAYETGKDPFQDDTGAPDYYMYHDNVVAGLDYIFLQAGTYGPGAGITFQMSGHETYNTGIAMMAIAASRTPGRVVVSANPVVNGLTYQQVVQGCVDYFVFAQNPDGAWRYWYTDEPSDNSNTGYATLGLRYAEGFGCTVPQAVKDNLSPWLDFIQDDVDGDVDDGGSWYTDGWAWVNLLKTGNLLFEFAFVGDTVGVGRVDDAVDYIERTWNTPTDEYGYPQWQNNYQAMYCLMKGFEAHGIDTIWVGADPFFDWFDEIADHILATQNPDGSWPWDVWGGPLLTTEWALLTLEKVTAPPPPTIRCRCPNFYFFAATEDGENPESQTMTIYNFGAPGCAPLEWTVSDGADWLTLSPPSGTTMRTMPGDQVEISVDISDMSAGRYFTWITVEAPGATNTPQRVPVFLHIRASYGTLPWL